MVYIGLFSEARMLMSRARAEEEEEDQEGQRTAAVVYMRVECMLAAGRASRTRL